MSIISKRARLADTGFAAVRDFYTSSRYAQHRSDPDTCDFTFGNPHEMPLEGLVSAIRERAVPQDKNWFAYKTSEQGTQAFLAERVGRELQLAFEPADIALTAGAFAAFSYSYGKVLLAPGQRLGYLALSPLMPLSDRQALRDVMFSAQMALGWCFPNAVMQYALPDLDRLSIDQEGLARRRDRLTAVLTRAGFGVLPPEGTFYLWSEWPPGETGRHVCA